ncbi:MAG: TIM barrel protein [Planctomycetota bacterium]|jgi:sugar phosphate isomerase/epimerase
MDECPLVLGFKIQLGWCEQASEHLPCVDADLYALLRARGFDYVEFGVGTCTDDGELALLRREAAACAEAGLGVSLHPYLPGAFNPACFGETGESRAVIDSVLGAGSIVAGITGRSGHLNLHPAELQHDALELAAAASLRQRLLARSRRFFAALEERARGHALVRPVVEHQVPPGNGEPTIRIGDTCAELLEVVADTDLGFCWDTGHYLASVERYGQADPPPDDFVRRVEAVHLHDLVAAQDHQPVSPASARLGGCVRTLLAVGFSGGVTLEYSAAAIAAAGGFEPVIADSLRVLTQWTGPRA